MKIYINCPHLYVLYKQGNKEARVGGFPLKVQGGRQMALQKQILEPF
jgi:hypothetical protein